MHMRLCKETGLTIIIIIIIYCVAAELQGNILIRSVLVYMKVKWFERRSIEFRNY